jgi:hypothetical protein
MKKINNAYLMSMLLLFSLLIGCDKTKPYDIVTPPVQAHFLNSTGGSYYVKNDPNSVFKIPVGLTSTNSSATNQVVSISVASPTNAVSGTQYTLPSATVNIPAGKAVDSLSVKGIFAGFPGTRVDTLVFSINNGDVKASDYNKVYKLVLRKYCDVVPASLTGNYTRCFDIQPPSPNYGPYKTAISSAVLVTPTTGYIVVTNFWDVGGSPITIDLDWSNPANFTTSVRTQPLYVDPTYGQATIRPVGTGSFSSCDNTFTIKYQVTVAAGSFGSFTTTIAR